MINIDTDGGLRNADWLRTRRWDLPTDKDEFLATIGGKDQLAHFMTLPAAEAMPATLRAALGVGPKKIYARVRIRNARTEDR